MKEIKLVEEFQPHPIHTDYEISTYGRVYSHHFKKFLRINLDKDGYRYVFIQVDGKTKRKQVHRLMCETFIPNPNNLPIVCFKTSRKDVPTIKDLFWCDSTTRIKNSYKRGFYPTQRKSSKTKRTLVTDDLIQEITKDCYKGKTNQQIVDKYQISPTTLWKIKNEKYGNIFNPLSNFKFEN